jgi:putative methyltransferase (TIGR04325 family)
MAGVSSVLDFGGGCGLHYKQAQSPAVRWAVVETLAMVQRAKELSTDRLQFFSHISDAADWLGRPIDVMHSNGALLYTPQPLQNLERLCALRARKMIWNRANLSAGGIEHTVQTSHLVDNGPGRAPRTIKNKTVKHSLTKFPRQRFLQPTKTIR